MKNSFLPIVFGFLFVSLSLSSCVNAQAVVEKPVVIDNALLQEVVDHNRNYTSEGEVADYIPELEKPIPMILPLQLSMPVAKFIKRAIMIKPSPFKVFPS